VAVERCGGSFVIAYSEGVPAPPGVGVPLIAAIKNSVRAIKGTLNRELSIAPATATATLSLRSRHLRVQTALRRHSSPAMEGRTLRYTSQTLGSGPNSRVNIAAAVGNRDRGSRACLPTALADSVFGYRSQNFRHSSHLCQRELAGVLQYAVLGQIPIVWPNKLELSKTEIPRLKCAHAAQHRIIITRKTTGPCC
jgi:hypothetical protein